MTRNEANIITYLAKRGLYDKALKVIEASSSCRRNPKKCDSTTITFQVAPEVSDDELEKVLELLRKKVEEVGGTFNVKVTKTEDK